MTQRRDASPARSRRRAMPFLGRKGRDVLLSVGGVVLFVAVAQAASLWGPRQWAVPTLPQFLGELGALIGAPHFLIAILDTVTSVLGAVGIALALGLVVGIAFGFSPFIASAVGLPLEFIRPIPAMALIPVAILALGQGQAMEIGVATLACWWPILFNTLYGVRQVDPVARDAARTLGCGAFGVATRVVVPSLLPFVFAGLRTSMPLALVIVVGAEYLATAQRGLGGVLITATSGGDLNTLWATAAVTGALGILLGGVVALAERIACPWVGVRTQ